MERIKGILGFGGMRLPMKDGEVVIDEMNRMVDAFLEAGFNYFDTAHGYLQGQSELALPGVPGPPLPPGPFCPHRQAHRLFFQEPGGHPPAV